MAKIEYKGIIYDSQEEIEFVQWLEEAKAAGYVISWTYQPETFVLAEKNDYLTKQIYTPDFVVVFSKKIDGLDHGFIYHRPLAHAHKCAYFDIKGIFGRGQNNSSAYTFPVAQRWMYDKLGIYVNKIVARDMKVKIKGTKDQYKVTKSGFFSKTWVPKAAAYQPKHPWIRNSAFKNCKLIEEIGKD